MISTADPQATRQSREQRRPSNAGAEPTPPEAMDARPTPVATFLVVEEVTVTTGAPDGALADAADDEIELEPSPDGPPSLPRAKAAAASDGAAADDAEEPEPISVTGHLPAPVWPPVTVADLMTRKVITLQQNEPIGDLEAWMERFRFHHLPVVDASKKLVGLISHTDLLHAAHGVGPGGQPIPKAGPTTPASAIMRKSVVTGHPDAPLITACRVMLHEKLGCLPIILEDATLVGIVTGTDFTRLSLEMLERTPAR